MNIYISNLNFATKDESLRNLFAGYGDVSSANIITDRETGRSRGFGFVEMPDETQGRSAIDALNETEFEGKVITVNVARPKTERNDRGGFGNNGGYGRRRYWSVRSSGFSSGMSFIEGHTAFGIVSAW